MKKKLLFLLFLMIVASLDVIGIDKLRINANVALSADDPNEDARFIEDDPNGRNVNSGVPPEGIEAVIREELMMFPIPQSVMHPEYQASFEDSWMSERTFGGERGHEGTDIMLNPDVRGLFPVLSMTDGVVEKKGWLPKGGYRLGIRSSGGIYYYYAHFYDYAEGIEPGTNVVAGQFLGFAGDSGYSNIEGTVGNFPVHLHIGIYYDDEEGIETPVNPYPFLASLEKKHLDY